MKTIQSEVEILHIERKSKFIGYAKPVNTKEEALSFLENIKSKHSDASHNVYVYKINNDGKEYFKFSDDGEPQNTAGKPIAEIINMLDLNNLIVVISRYFGGIKLGAGGLIRHYAKAGKLAIDEAKIVEFDKKIDILIDFEYNKINDVDKVLLKNNCEIIDKNFDNKVTYKIRANGEGINELENLNILIINI